MIIKINKIFLVILFTSLFLNTSVNTTGAFLDSDLGLNLYRDLDEWLSEFEEKMYVYEISGQDKQNISENINKILSTKWMWECLVDWINSAIVQSIVDGNTQTVLENMKEECYNPETKEYSSKKVWEIVNELWYIKNYYLNKSKEKAQAIHEISRIWMYSDWNTDNSPFDIIKDLDDINAILFTDEIIYEDEDVSFLKDYQNKPLIWPLLYSSSNPNNDLGTTSSLSDDNKDINDDSDDEITDNDDENNDDINESQDNNNLNNESQDWNNYLCPTDEHESWLNNDSLNSLIWSMSWVNTWFVFNYWTSWHELLPITNKIHTAPSLTSSSFETEMLENWISLYEEITDNDIWKCNEFFCIITEFIVRNQKALDYWVSHSVQNIIETSNKHLKKAANTSLVQSKMTTNNFEISLRDLDLTDIFHLWVNISFKSPPILNLENISWDQNISAPDLEIKDMLMKKYKSLWLNYEDSNNLNKFKKRLEEMKWIIASTENPATRAADLNKELQDISKLRSEILNYNKEVVHKELNNDILRDFNKQFTEIEQYNINMMNYVYDLDTLIKKLKEIPTYSW